MEQNIEPSAEKGLARGSVVMVDSAFCKGAISSTGTSAISPCCPKISVKGVETGWAGTICIYLIEEVDCKTIIALKSAALLLGEF